MDTRMADLFSDKKNNCLWILYRDIQKFDLEKNAFTFNSGDSLLQGANLNSTVIPTLLILPGC
ncbi:MAG: hypothetical protein JWR72_3419 [Flavisolibacter sp.]|nr:hypothetical protein [Flavisolibacter sp.]